MRERLDAWLFALLLLAGAGCIAFLSTRYGVAYDWTAHARASLSSESRAVLKSLKGPVAITSYASPGTGLRGTISAFVARYQRFKPDLTLRFVDPATDPAGLRARGIRLDGELVVRYAGREQHLDELSERSLTDALARLGRGGDRVVAFVGGDGERRPDGHANADLGLFMTELAARGIRALPLDLDRSGAVPGHTDLVVLASPQAQLAPQAVQALRHYVDDGGNLLWLTEPDSAGLGLAPLAQTLGVQTLPGTLVDPRDAAAGLLDARMQVVTTYPPQTITRGFALTTLFPHAAALAHRAGSGWAVQPILRSAAASYTAHQADAGAPPPYDAGAGDLRGPLDFGYALTRLSPSPAKSQQRVVVIGDGDFLSNSFLGNGGNRAFGERVFNWLLGDDALVAMPARGAPDRHLALGQRGLDALALVFLIALPLVLAGFGAALAWRRRRR